MAGYEGSDHINGEGVALSMNEANAHWQRLPEDYALLADFGIRTVRESVGWRITELRGEQGWQRLREHAELAERHGIEVIWSLMHYGWPQDIDLMSPVFVERFVAFSVQTARVLRAASSDSRFYQPINEISFLTWALTSTGLMHRPGQRLTDAHAVKRQLVRAALRACEAIAAVDPGARFMHSDPVIDVAPPPGCSDDLIELARQQSEDGAFEAWDMLCGAKAPELGGTPDHLGVVGINYYHDNHWELGTGQRLEWHLGDPRRRPFSQLAAPVWKRFGRPMMIAETSHVGIGRARWLDDIANQILLCRQQGMPLEGVCLYPIVDRHDWGNTRHWHNSGLWDVEACGPGGAEGSLDRALCVPYAERLRHWQQFLPGGAQPHPLTSDTPSRS
ncbi:MAG: hypothetical protein V4731_02650 [Pseudomonadota bacterium]